jgi:hypothetical protein
MMGDGEFSHWTVDLILQGSAQGGCSKLLTNGIHERIHEPKVRQSSQFFPF